MSPLASHIIFLPSVGLALAALKPAASFKHGKIQDPCAQLFGLHTAIRSDSEDYVKHLGDAIVLDVCWEGPSRLLVRVWHISKVVSGRL